MNILFLTHLFPNSINTRHGIFWLKKSVALRSVGAEVRVIAPVPYIPKFLARLRPSWWDYWRVERRGQLKGIEVEYIRYLRPPGKWFRPFEGISIYWSCRKRVRELHEEKKISAILGGMLNDGIAALKLSKDLNTSAHCFAIGDDVNVYPHESQKIYRDTEFLLQNLDSTFSVGKNFIASIKKTFPRLDKEVYWNPVGIDLEQFRPGNHADEIRGRFKIPEQVKIGLYVGYLYHLKGTQTILDSLNELKNIPVCFVLAGTGEMLEPAKSYVQENGLEDKCKFVGHVEHDDIMRLYQQADFFIFPSFMEGSPTVLVEAAACGLPIIASDIPPNFDMLREGENGYSFKVGDAADMKEKVEMLVNDTHKMAEFSENSRKFAEEDHDYRVQAKRLVEVMKETSSARSYQ